MRKILVVSPTGTMDNGAEISIFYLMEYLVSQGHKVVNVVPQAHHPAQTQYAEKQRNAGIQVEFVDILKWWWPDAPGDLGGTMEDAAYFYRENVGDISRLIQKHHIDVVVTNTVNMFQGALAAAVTSTPHIWLIHEFPEKEFAYYREKIDFLEEYSDELFGVAGELERELQHLLPQKQIRSFISYSDIDPTDLAKGTSRRIVSVGRITERKNQLELLKVYQRLAADDVTLTLIGPWDDDYKAVLDNYIQEQQISGVTFTGNLTDPWEALTDQDICVFPSALETFGLVYAEAVLKGIPVIISDNPGHLSAYDFFEVGKIYPLGDQDKLTTILKELLQNFENEKLTAQKNAVKAREKYQIKYVYADLIQSIEVSRQSMPSPIRHVDFLLETNNQKSAVDKQVTKAKKFSSKVINKLKRMFKTS